MTTCTALCDYAPRLTKPYRNTIRNFGVGAFLAFIFMVPIATGAAVYANMPKTFAIHAVTDDSADAYTPAGDEPPVVDAVVEKS